MVPDQERKTLCNCYIIIGGSPSLSWREYINYSCVGVATWASGACIHLLLHSHIIRRL